MLVITGGAGLIVICSQATALVPPAFVALIERKVVSAVVGVPVSAPERELNARPAGRVPITAKLVGLFVAVIV